MSIHSFKFAIALALANLANLPALAAPPAPEVTVGADTKQLRFDWDIVPRSNYYELWFKANDGAPYVKFGDSKPPWQPHFLSSVSAHLLDWDQARYQVKACNPSGCGASPPIAVDEFMADTIGYFKAGRLHNNGRFGIATAISEDGNTLAAFTAGETAPDFPKAAVYVFVKSNGRWVQQARLIPESGIDPIQNLGLHPGSEPTLSLSADGNVLAAGMAFTDPTRNVDSAGVTVYRRSGGTWTQEFQKIYEQFFAAYVGAFFTEMDEAGNHIIFRPGGVNQPAEMLVRGASGWTSQAIQNPPTDLSNGYFCVTPRLSGDGQYIAWQCAKLLGGGKQLFVSTPPNWQMTGSVPINYPAGHFVNRTAIDYAGTTIAVASYLGNQSEVRIVRPVAGSWEVSAPITAGAWNSSTEGRFATDIDLSRDGALLAILDPRDTGQGTGVLSPPLQPGTEPTGATYIYELRAQGPRLRRVLKPNNAIPEGGLYDGQVRFGNNGKTLVVSEPDEPGNSSGIDGNRNAGGRIKTGAVWLY